tara:strand:+ start:1443 stop:2576 length:1134 start_codon:yes stop_codon:yes gene_type:complete
MSRFEGLTVNSGIASATYRLVDTTHVIFAKEGNPDALQAREYYGSEDQIASLKESIKAKGLLESPIVMPVDNGQYRVIEGNRRMFALNSLINEDGIVSTDDGKALTKVRVEVRKPEEDLVEEHFNEWFALNPDADQELQDDVREHFEKLIRAHINSDSLVRNTLRLNWNDMEIARAAQAQLDLGVPLEDFCSRTGMSEKSLKSRLSLLAKEDVMPDVVQAVEDGEVSFSVGKILANIKEEHGETRSEILEKAKSSTDEEGNTTKAATVAEVYSMIAEEEVEAGEVIRKDVRKRTSKKSPSKMASEDQLHRAILDVSSEREEISIRIEETKADGEDPVDADQNALINAELILEVLKSVAGAKDLSEPLEDVLSEKIYS